jgi:hypothetical protein
VAAVTCVVASGPGMGEIIETTVDGLPSRSRFARLVTITVATNVIINTTKIHNVGPKAMMFPTQPQSLLQSVDRYMCNPMDPTRHIEHITNINGRSVLQ